MKNRIMLGVCLMCLARKIKKPYVAESSVFVMLAAILSILVSVPSVLSNMINSGNLARYFVVAFSSTDIMVQLILVLGFAIVTKTIINFSHLNSVGRVPLS